MRPQQTERFQRGRKRIAAAALAVIGILVVARAALPYAVERYVNGVLRDFGEYAGRVDDVDIALWRGEYSLQNLEIEKSAPVPVPFFSAPRIHISIEWRALFEGALVAELEAVSPRIAFVDAEKPRRSQKGLGPDWAETLEALAPFRFNRVTANDGRLEFRNFESDPPVELYIEDVELVAENLTNIRDRARDVFATVRARGIALGSAPVSVNARADPITDPPEVEVDAELEGLPLTDLNPFLEAYANVDAQAGRFSVYTEFAAADGRFEGYVKPLLEGADIFRLSEDEPGFFRKAWEAIVDLVTEALENQPESRFATRVPLSGELDAVQADLIPAVFNVLRNAFVQAFAASISGTIGLEDVENPLDGEAPTDGSGKAEESPDR